MGTEELSTWIHRQAEAGLLVRPPRRLGLVIPLHSRQPLWRRFLQGAMSVTMTFRNASRWVISALW
jgi:hypothetical protein